MRVIAGKHRGKILKEFSFDGVRPTADRAKEALFNILQFKIPNSTFLDLFSGSGNVGIEAISRGAKEVVLVDLKDESIKLTKENLASVNEVATVIKADSVSYLKNCDRRFDVIFIDPPYQTDLGEQTLKIISDKRLLSDGGIAVYEHKQDFSVEFENLEAYSERRYGIALFTFYKMKEHK